MPKSHLNRFSSVLLGTVSLLCAGSATAAEISKRVRWVDFDPAEQPKINQIVEGQCLPDARHFAFDIPVQADVVFVFWGLDRPRCDADDPISRKKPDTVMFLSRQPPSEVEHALDDLLVPLGFTRHDPRANTDPCCHGRWDPEGEDLATPIRTVFIRSPIENFCWNQHVYTAPMVFIHETYGIYDFSRYETIISIFRPDLTMPPDPESGKPADRRTACSVQDGTPAG